MCRKWDSYVEGVLGEFLVIITHLSKLLTPRNFFVHVFEIYIIYIFSVVAPGKHFSSSCLTQISSSFHSGRISIHVILQLIELI